MKTAIFNWLNHHIRIELSDPDDGNTIYVEIHRQTGTYDPELYNSYLTDYQFSAESNDPNDWVVEGVKSALAQLAHYGHQFHSPKAVPVAAAAGSSDELDDIPF
jgi:hypothetical protein